MFIGWKIVLGIALIGLYTLSILEYCGIYWPLTKKYEGFPNRRSLQKKLALLSALMSTIFYLRKVIFSDFTNLTLYKIS